MQTRFNSYLLMMIFVISQPFAVNALPCESMQSLGQMQHGDVSHVMSSNMSHQMSSNTQVEMLMDCCQQYCTCPFAGNASFAVLNSFSQASSLSLSTRVLLPLPSLTPAFIPVLNKPPIYS